MRRNIVAGNWKMNRTFEEADDLLFAIADPLQKLDLGNTEVILCPPVLYAEMFTDVALENNFSVGAQNCSNHESGAYTGEISAAMLKSMDIEYCIVGHSERRKYFNENSEMLAGKVNQLLDNEISPLFCCGEVLEEREAGKHFEVVGQQLFEGLFHLSADELDNVIIAYEPVWAIGTGKTATPAQAQEMHAFIRSLIAKKYDQEIADDTTILYGGSCNAKNAKELFALKDVDGGLIGGASLQADDFLKIVQSF
ncbi:MAG TPA: triose-phosphate isomerase [Bacteroidales bacterium]|nr:triose-phosphate isomerase [Bacteroidales bacterium]